MKGQGSFISRSLEAFKKIYKKKDGMNDQSIHQSYEYENRQVPTEAEEDVVSSSGPLAEW